MKTGWIRLIVAHNGAYLVWGVGRSRWSTSAWRALDALWVSPAIFGSEQTAKRGHWIPGTRKVITVEEYDALMVMLTLAGECEPRRRVAII
jgi:hypothetical protein